MCTYTCKGPLYQIVFDDRTAPTTISPSLFKQARAAYLALPLEELTEDRTAHSEPEPRRRAVVPPASEQQTASGPPPEQQQQQQPTTDGQQIPPPLLHTQRRGRPPSTVLVVQQKQQSSTCTGGLQPPGSIINTTGTIPSTNSTTDINVDAISNDIIIADISNNGNSQCLLLCCAIPDCVEYCNSATSHICINCPPKSRCYLYCTLHELHASHTNQSSCRRSNTPISSNNNNTNSSTFIVQAIIILVAVAIIIIILREEHQRATAESVRWKRMNCARVVVIVCATVIL